MSATDAGQDQAAPADSAGQATPAEFDSLEETPASSENAGTDINLDMVLNVDVDLALEVGRTTLSVRDLLQLNQGSVVELDRLAGEPLDVLINGTLIARGEVVVVNDKYGIRLTDVVSPTERIKRFQ